MHGANNEQISGKSDKMYTFNFWACQGLVLAVDNVCNLEIMTATQEHRGWIQVDLYIPVSIYLRQSFTVFPWLFFFFFRNILYRLDDRTQQFSVLLEAAEHWKLHQSNETLQAILSKVFNSFNSAQVCFKAGLEVFEATSVGNQWQTWLLGICTHATKNLVYIFQRNTLDWAWNDTWLKSFLLLLFLNFKKGILVSRYFIVALDNAKAAFCTVENLLHISIFGIGGHG